MIDQRRSVARISSARPAVTGIVSKPHLAPRFVVQLCQSAPPINPRDVPQLDLFDVYHLYCVRKAAGCEIQHSLRVGYFKEPGTAKAVATYLARYFSDPLVIQVDAAEIVSSLRAKFLPRKDIGATGQHAAVVLATPAAVTGQRPPKVTAPSADHGTAARSLWSRLLEPLRRLNEAAQEP